MPTLWPKVYKEDLLGLVGAPGLLFVHDTFRARHFCVAVPIFLLCLLGLFEPFLWAGCEVHGLMA